MTGFEKHRRAASYTQEMLANELHLDRSTVAKWETGVAVPRVDTLQRLAHMFGCRMEDLLTDDEEEKTA